MFTNPFSLENKTVLVTGAASGIGKATAILCSNMGANIIITDINGQGLQDTFKILDSSKKNKMTVADLTDEDSINTLLEGLPILDGVASIAGIPNTAPVQFYKKETIDKVFNINTFAPIFLMKGLVNKRKLNKLSSVVFVASLAGIKHYTIGNGIYGMSKSAIDTYMHFAAVELASKGIRCNAVNPAMVETALAQQLNRSDESRLADIKKYPLKRYGLPEDIASAIVYLLSDASSWVTGHSLIIDGGRSLV